MGGMFQKKKSNKSATQNLKNLIIEKFRLNEDTTVSIAELSCHEPNCPPKETIITIRKADGSTSNLRIHKALDQIQREDVKTLRHEKN
jgi:hypothetical protein